MRIFASLFFCLLLFQSPALGLEDADLVLVIKSESKLLLLKEGEVFCEYRAAFGANPEGHKQREGDERTPEGRYVLDYKNRDSAFYKSIHISYPNRWDRDRKSTRLNSSHYS